MLIDVSLTTAGGCLSNPLLDSHFLLLLFRILGGHIFKKMHANAACFAFLVRKFKSAKMCKDVNYCSSTMRESPQLCNLKSIFRLKSPKCRYIRFALLFMCLHFFP